MADQLNELEGTKRSKHIRVKKKHKKSKVGCAQCKQRRIKCDETLPSCKNCLQRSVRCGYLDYTPREIQLVQLAHWEAEGSDPLTNPVSSQAYNPSQPIIVYRKDKSNADPTDAFPTFLMNDRSNHIDDYRHLPHQQNIQDIRKLQLQHEQGVGSSYHKSMVSTADASVSSNRSIKGVGGSSSSIFSKRLAVASATATSTTGVSSVADKSLNDSKRSAASFTASHPIRYLRDNEGPGLDQPIILKSPLSQQATTTSSDSASSASLLPKQAVKSIRHSKKRGGYAVNLVKHVINDMPIDFKRYPEFFDETIPNTISRIFLNKRTNAKLLNAWTNLELFYGMLLQSSGDLSYSCHPELDYIFLRYRGRCMNYILENLPKLNDDNAHDLLMVTSLLNVSSVSMRESSLREHFALATGPGSILKEAYEDPARFPKSFKDLKNHADGLLFTARYVWLPTYNSDVVRELYEVLKDFGEKFIENEDYTNNDEKLKKQYDNTIEFLEFSLDILENEGSPDEVLRYPVGKLYRLVQRWYAIFPSECYTLGSKMPPINKIFYVFWFTLLQILKNVLMGCRYVFTYFLDGYFLMQTFSREQVLVGMADSDELKWYLNYCCRVIAFFSRRVSYLMRNTILNDPIPTFFQETDRFKVRSMDIHERCISSFRTTVIKKIHYPMESTNSRHIDKSNSSRENYYAGSAPDPLEGLNTLDSGYSSIIDEYFGHGENSSADLDYLSLCVGGSDGETVDLLNGIDPKTSLLKDDFDPRFTDPIFNVRVNFQPADLDFLAKYIEDRKLIIQMGVEGR